MEYILKISYIKLENLQKKMKCISELYVLILSTFFYHLESKLGGPGGFRSEQQGGAHQNGL